VNPVQYICTMATSVRIQEIKDLHTYIMSEFQIGIAVQGMPTPTKYPQETGFTLPNRFEYSVYTDVSPTKQAMQQGIVDVVDQTHGKWVFVMSTPNGSVMIYFPNKSMVHRPLQAIPTSPRPSNARPVGRNDPAVVPNGPAQRPGVQQHPLVVPALTVFQNIAQLIVGDSFGSIPKKVKGMQCAMQNSVLKCTVSSAATLQEAQDIHALLSNIFAASIDKLPTIRFIQFKNGCNLGSFSYKVETGSDPSGKAPRHPILKPVSHPNGGWFFTFTFGAKATEVYLKSQ